MAYVYVIIQDTVQAAFINNEKLFSYLEWRNVTRNFMFRGW